MDIKARLTDLEILISSENPTKEALDEFNIVKHDWEQMESHRTRGSIIRSKARWVETGKKSSKYFLNLEKHSQDLKHLKCVKLDENRDYMSKNYSNRTYKLL